MTVLVIREHTRFAVCRKARVGREGRRAGNALLIELSVGGCRLSNLGNRAFTLEETVELRIDSHAPIAGRVRWSRDGTIGLRFVQPLSFAALDRLVRLCRDSDPAAEPDRAFGT